MKLKNTLLAFLLSIGTLAHAEMVTITSTQQFNDLVAAQNPLIAIFSATWCGACQAIKEPLHNAARDESLAPITFAYIDVDTNKELAQKHKVQSIPALIFINKGAVVHEEVGASSSNFIQWIKTMSTTHKLLSGDSSSQSQAPESSQTSHEGILSKIADLFKALLNGVINVIRSTLEAIKGIF